MMTAYDALLWFHQVGWRKDVYCLPANIEDLGHTGAALDYASDIDQVLGAFVRSAKKRQALLAAPSHAREAAEMALELIAQGKPVYPALCLSMLQNVPLRPLPWVPNSKGLGERLLGFEVTLAFGMTTTCAVGAHLRRRWPHAFELPEPTAQLTLLP